MPVNGEVTSRFSRSRFHPILQMFRAHRGVDLSAPSGTRVVAPASGHVMSVGWRLGYGLTLELAHSGGVVHAIRPSSLGECSSRRQRDDRTGNRRRGRERAGDGATSAFRGARARQQRRSDQVPRVDTRYRAPAAPVSASTAKGGGRGRSREQSCDRVADGLADEVPRLP